MKYKIMRMRTKISYSAFKKNVPTQQLFLTNILRTFGHIASLKQLDGDPSYGIELQRSQDSEFQKIIHQPEGSMFLQIMIFNEKELQVQDRFVYNRIKYQESNDNFKNEHEVKNSEQVEVKDQHGNRKIRSIDHAGNLSKAKDLKTFFSKTKASDLFS